MIRGITLLWTIFALLAGVGMFMVKYKVQALEEDLRTVNQQIRADRRQIHVLEAEWAYLNQPDRLRNLAERYLNLKPLEPGQVMTLASLPPRPDILKGTKDTLVAAGPDGTLVVPWASYPLRKPGAGAPAWVTPELASTRVGP